jgi:peptidoglycan hydrolase-like protein with peptidoglycan-binding domain
LPKVLKDLSDFCGCLAAANTATDGAVFPSTSAAFFSGGKASGVSQAAASGADLGIKIPTILRLISSGRLLAAGFCSCHNNSNLIFSLAILTGQNA